MFLVHWLAYHILGTRQGHWPDRSSFIQSGVTGGGGASAAGEGFGKEAMEPLAGRRSMICSWR
jgi:hypothetical protein